MKKNGFDRPFHPYQITSWVVSLSHFIVIFAVIMPSLKTKREFIILTTFTTFSLLLLCALGFWATLFDPKVTIMSQREA